MRKLIAAAALIVAATAVWGSVAIAQNANGSHLPLGPVGTSACEQAIADVQSSIPDAIASVQNDIDSVTSDPAVAAALAAEVAAAAPGLSAEVAAAGHDLGC